MKAVLMAAGSGTRLTHLTKALPKALVRVQGEPLVDYVLRYTAHPAIDETLVVGGFCADQLARHVAGRPRVRFFENPDYTRGNLLSFLAARAGFAGDLLLLNVDHIFPARLLTNFLATPAAGDVPTAFVDFDRPLFDDDMKVGLDGERRVQRISKVLTGYEAGYIGSTFVPAACLARHLELCDAVLTRSAGMANVEAVLQEWADRGARPRLFDASGTRWLEVDTPQDLANAERILSNVRHFLD